MKTNLKKIIPSLLLGLFCSTAFAEGWNKANDPRRFDLDMNQKQVRKFSSLPLGHQILGTGKFWSDSWWASNEGSIALRWQLPKEQKTLRLPFYYRSPTKAEAFRMKSEDIALLSPAEKYDIFMGKFDYPTVAMVKSFSNESMPEWFGICHGWAPASMNHVEPKAVVIPSKDGILIPFGSADVKALLDLYYARYNLSVSQIGRHCKIDAKKNPKDFAQDERCADINAGSFHLSLANEIGIKKTGLLAEVWRDLEMWNQPVYGYESQIIGEQGPSRGAAKGTVKEVIVKTKMFFADDDHPAYEPSALTSAWLIEAKDYEYRLELNALGDIIGGEWISWDRPDYLWLKNKIEISQFEGPLSGIGRIYQPIDLPPATE